MKRKWISDSSASSTSSSEAYDAFLNFRGSDLRHTFVDCLYVFLTEAGIHVFMDGESLHVGENIGDELKSAIESSKLYVPIFSRNYASSTWCLIELAQMVDCARKSNSKEILPVFFDVEPEDVKLKTELYTKDLLYHEECSGQDTVRKWREALQEVSQMKGWNLQTNQGQGKLLKQIAKHISRRLERQHRILPDHFIGNEKQVQEIMDKLDCGSRDVRIVVIHGMGGIGKTTLANAVFNKLCQKFQGCSFLSSVRESATTNVTVNLQNKLLRDLLRFSSCNFSDANDAMNCIQGLVQKKNVLVVLDDVSDMDQIRKLTGMGDWVGLRSRVIITTRNCVDEIENMAILQGKKLSIYQMRELDFDDSLQLLCRHAFNEYEPSQGYEQLSHDILSFTGGIPLALEVIGSYLKGKRVAIWKETLNKFRKVPNDRRYREILMSSYEMLNDEEKEIFLDIVFFFSDEDKTDAFYYWEACSFFPETSIDTLISYAMIKVVHSKRFWIHDLFKELGREVVRKQSNGNLGMRSRLCNEDALCLLSQKEGSKYVKALQLESKYSHNFTPAELSGLINLRFLELHGGSFVGEFDDGCLSELRWFSWKYCSSDFRINNSCFKNLVVLKLSNSNITDSWAGWKHLKTARSLKSLELLYLNLTRTPDVSAFLSLERLVFRQYQGLVRVDPSIGSLRFLNTLEFVNDRAHPGDVVHLPSSIGNLKALSRLAIKGLNLKQLPESFRELKSLTELEIGHCESLEKLPDSIGDLESLRELNIMSTGITELPESFRELKRLTKLVIGHCESLENLPDSIGDLESLRELNIMSTGITELPESFRELKRLTKLEIRHCQSLENLPDSIGDLESLRELNIMSTGITELPESFRELKSLTKLEIGHCKSLENLPDSIGDLESLLELSIAFTGITELPESFRELKSLTKLEIGHCKSMENLPDSIGDLESLRALSIAFTGITELPESIGKLRNLIVLCVGDNQLKGLPATLGKLERLEELSVIDNRDLKGQIPFELHKLSSLRVLDLSGTGIWGLPVRIKRLSRLESLRLLNCDEIEFVPDLPNSLTVLAFSFGLLKAVPDLSSLTNLERLHLSNRSGVGNRLVNPPVRQENRIDWIQHLPKLEDLSLDISPMPHYLSTGFNLMSQIRNLELSCPNPSDVCLPSGLEHLTLDRFTSLSRWEFLSNLPGLSNLQLCGSVATEIWLDGLELLKNLTGLTITNCEFLERVHGISRLQQLETFSLFSLPKLVEIEGLSLHPDSLKRLQILQCNMIGCLPAPESPSQLSLSIGECSMLQDYEGPYDGYFEEEEYFEVEE